MEGLRNYSGGVGQAGPLDKQVIEELDPSTNLPLDQSPKINKEGLRYYGRPMKATEQRSDFLPSEYEDYFTGVYSGVGERYLGKHRSQEQSSGEQFVGFLNQALVGEILGGSIEGIGYALDLKQYGDLLSDTEKEFGNWFSDLGKKLRTWSEEATPIYRDPEAPKFDPGSFSWWMQNGKSVASTLSLMLPSSWAIRGLSAVGKFMGMANKIAPMASRMFKGLSQAAISRHMEGLMEASQVYEESYEKGLSKGMSPEEAQQYASNAASQTYKLDWAMYLQDAVQYTLLNKSFGKASAGLAEKSIAGAAAMGHKLAPVMASKAAAIGWTGISEFFEEGYQFIVAEESKYLADKLAGLSSDSSFDERLNKYVKDGELWTSMVMGALGGMVTQTVGKKIHDLIQGGDPQANFVKKFTAEAELGASHIHAADLMGSESGKKGAFVNYEVSMFEKAIASKSPEYARELIKIHANPTPEDIKRFNINEELTEFFKENEETLNKDLDKYVSRWEDNAKKYEGAKAFNVTRYEFLLDKYDANRKEYKGRLDQLKDQIINYDKLSLNAKGIFDTTLEIKAAEKKIQFLEDRLNNTKKPLGKEQRKENERLLTLSNKELTSLVTKLRTYGIEYDPKSKTYKDNREEQEKKEDDSVNIGGPYNLLDAKSDKEITSYAMVEAKKLQESVSFADMTIAMAQKELDKILKQKAPVQPEKPKPSEDSIAVDRYVRFKKDGIEMTGIIDSVDTEGKTYSIIPTTKWSDKSTLATRPIGDPVVIPWSDDVQLDKNQFLDEELIFESAEDTTVEDTEFSGTSGREAFLSAAYYGSDFKVRNEELHEFLLKNQLDGVEAEFFIDTDSDIAKQWFTANKIPKSEIDYLNSGKVTKQYLNDFLTNHDIVGKIPIGIRLVKDGKAFMANNTGMWYHRDDFNRKFVPYEIERKGLEAVTKYKQAENDKIHKARIKILTGLLSGNRVFSSNLKVGAGHFNNDFSKGDVTDRLNIELNEVKMAVSRTKNRAWSSPGSIVANISSTTPGTPFVLGRSSINGEPRWVKCNPTKLTTEHAEILWNAIVTRYRKGALSPVIDDMTGKVDDRVKGLNAGEVINLLALFGERKTNPNHPAHPTGDMHLKSKQLFVHSGRYLFFGVNLMGKDRSIDMYEDNMNISSDNRTAFINWATTNKNYSIPLGLPQMGVELNTPLNRTFSIGSWKNEPNKDGTYLTLAQFLVSSPVDGKNTKAIVSDLDAKRPFVRPLVILGSSLDDFKSVEPLEKKRAKSPPKDTTLSTTKKKVVKEVKKDQTITKPFIFMNLPVDSSLYIEYPAEYEEKDGEQILVRELEKAYIGKVISDKSGIYFQVGVGTKSEFLKLHGPDGKISDEERKEAEAFFNKKLAVAKGVKGRLIADVSGTVEEETVEKEEEGEAKVEETKPPTDLEEILGDILGGTLMEAIGDNSYSPINIQKELEWIHKNFGDIKVEERDKLIKLAFDGRLAFSVFTSDCIYLYSNAPEGALYHEAFHRVLLGYLSETERQRIYDSARKQFNRPDASIRELDELLAEDFRKYRLSGTKPKSRTIGQFFQDLLNFIYTFFTGNTKLGHADINRLYASIDRGQFRYSKISLDNYRRLKALEMPMAVKIHGTNVPLISNHHDLDKVIKFLTGILIEENKVESINDIKNMSMAPLFSFLERRIGQLTDGIDTRVKQLETGKIAKEDIDRTNKTLEIARNLRGIMQLVVDKDFKHLFIEKIADQLRKLNVKYNIDEEATLSDIAENNWTNIFDKNSFEINSKDNLLASVKFVIATLHKSNKIDPIIGIREYVDFNEMWNSIMHNLHDVTSVADMMGRLEHLASTEQQYPYIELLEKINNDNKGYLKHQIFTAVSKHKHKFVSFIADIKKGKVTKVEVADADVKSASRILLNSWNLYFYTNFNINDGKTIVINKDKINDLVSKYNDLTKRISIKHKNGTLTTDRDAIVEEFTALLNSAGMTDLDKGSVNAMISARRGESESDRIFQTINNDFVYLFDRINKIDTVTSLKAFNNEKFAKQLADHYVNSHPELISDMVLGPSGHQYFVYSANSHVTDQVNRFKTDKEFTEDHFSKIYNDNSFFGDQIMNSEEVRNNLEVLTFSMLNRSGAEGLDYFGINPIEDYLFKLIAMSKGIVTFPTLADKKTFYLIRGLNTFKFDFIHAEDGKLRYPKQATDILMKYVRSEANRINKALEVRKNYKLAEEAGDTARMNDILRGAVDNYHYIIRDGKIIFEEGNAYRFHHFPSLNAKFSEAISNNNFFEIDDSVRGEVFSSIVENVNQELEYAVKLGIIGVSDQSTQDNTLYFNRLIPEDIMSENRKNHGSDSNAIKNIIASHFINTVIANVENEKMFSGDPAFYKTGKDSKVVFEDKVKRLSVSSSTGENFASEVFEADILNSDINVATLETQKFPSINIDELRKNHIENNILMLKKAYPDMSDEDIEKEAKAIATKTLSAYNNLDTTDGQAWISPSMYRSLALRLGEWSDDKQRSFELLTSDRELTLEEEIQVSKHTFQPLKLVYFQLVHRNGLAIPTYYKASFTTIFRSMGKGKFGNMQIIELLDRMEKKGKYANNDRLEPIDMVVMDTGSTTKVGTLKKTRFFDEAGENVNDLSTMEVYKQPLNGLRRQLVTDAHDVDRTKTGTQFLKVALSNLFLDEAVYNINGVQKTGREVAQIAFDCLSALSNKGRADIENRLGYSNGKINKEKLVELLREDAKKSNATDNLVDSLFVDNGNFYMELDSFTDRKWMQSRIISLISKYAIDIELPGNQLIQFSNMGMRSVNPKYTLEEEAEKKSSHVDWIKNATDDLQFLTTKDGKTVPMGCIVSINLFKHIIPNYDTLTFEQKKEYLKSNPEILGYRIPTQGQSSLFMLKVMGIYPESIGDTITLPSEFTALTGSDFDIDKIYVVRHNYIANPAKKTIEKIKFLEGDTNDPKFLAKVYKERFDRLYRTWKKFVSVVDPTADKFSEVEMEMLMSLKEMSDTITTEDYLDSLIKFGRYDSTYMNKIEEVVLSNRYNNIDNFIADNKGKSLYEVNGRKAVENKLIDTFFAIMRSSAHFNGTSAPLGGLTKELQNMAKNVRESETISKPNMYYLSPRFNGQVKHDYTSGKEGVGPFALNNVHHILAQIAGLEMFGGFGDVLHKKNGNIDLSRSLGKDNVPISSWISALMDAHVDIAKDPYITDLNVNSFTYNIVSLLIRGGVGKDTFAFVSQPILRELAQESLLSDKNNYLTKRFSIGDKKYRNAKGYVTNKWTNRLSKEELDSLNNIDITTVFNSTTLTKDMSKSVDDTEKEFVKRQILVLRAFEELNRYGEYLNSLVQSSQIDTKKFGNTIVDLRFYLNKISQIYEDGHFTRESLERILPYDVVNGVPYNVEGANFLGNYVGNSIKLALDIFGQFSIYGTPVFEELLNKASLVTGNRFPRTDKVINNLSDEIFASLVSKFYTHKDFLDVTPDKLVKMLEQIPDTLSRIKNNDGGKYTDLKDNMFIKYIWAAPIEDEILPEKFRQFIFIPMKSVKDKIDRDSMIASFNELLADKRYEVSSLARRLLIYNYFATGLRNRIYSFGGFIPNELYKSITTIKGKPLSYNDEVIQKLLAEMKDIYNSASYNYVIDEVIINNHNDDTIVELLEGDNVAEYIESYKGTDYKETIAIKMHKMEKFFLGKNIDGDPLFRPYVKIFDQKLGHRLMKYIGTVTDMVEGVEMIRPVYVAVNMRSYASKGVIIKEYGFDKSIVPAYNELNIIKPEMEEEFLLRISNTETYNYVPRDEQLIYEQTNTQEYESKEERIEEGRKETLLTGETLDPTEFVDHSGGAIGADSEFENIGREYGVIHYNHYYHGEKTPRGNVEITDEEFKEGKKHVLEANVTLNRKPDSYMDLLARNWMQVKNADAIFAISTISRDGKTVDGGTGWAVQMAIDANKPNVYVFDQGFRNQWYKFDYDREQFVQLTNDEYNNLKLTRHFAGIGTRKINDKGKAAIRYLYENTFGTTKTTPIIKQQLDLFESTTEESPFTSDEKDKFSTEPKAVQDLVDEFGIKSSDDWTKLTPEQWSKLRDKYSHCKGI